MASAVFILGLVGIFICGLFAGIAIKTWQVTQLIADLESEYKVTLTRRQGS